MAAEAEEVTVNEDYIRWLQTSLNKTMNSNLSVDGRYGPLTRAAVLSFQRSRGLTPDGIVGQKTEQALIAVGGTHPPKHVSHAGHAGHKHWIAEVVPLLNKYRGDIPLEFLLGWIDVESARHARRDRKERRSG